jgi:YidC/Oxa1 family membrane protein insertase
MDNQRLILFLVFTFSAFFLYEAWQQYQRPPAPSVASQAVTPATPAETPASGVPTPSVALSGPTPVPATGGSAPGALSAAGPSVRVETDFLIAEISTAGGDLRHLELRDHRDTLDKSKPFVLLQQDSEHTYVAQSGLIGAELPNHRTQYTAAAQEYMLAPGADRLVVLLTAPTVNGVAVTKRYVFHRASHVIDVGYDVENNSAEPLPADGYFQFVRDGKMPAGSSWMLPTRTN